MSPQFAGDGTTRQVIVIVEPEIGLRSETNGIRSATGADISSLSAVLANDSITLEPLFGQSEERLRSATANLAEETSEPVPDLSVYYQAIVPAERAEAVAEQIRNQPGVAGAYVQPQMGLPFELNAMAPTQQATPPITPSFVLRQNYLDPAPVGIDTAYAWSLAGGRGAGVRVIDIEGGWRFSHEDLLQNAGGLIGGVQSTDLGWRNHGTAVLGEIGGDANAIGVTGIAPDANCRAVSVFRDASFTYNLPQALVQAANSLSPGDIILIEQQYGHPTRGWTTVEWWPAEFDAIRYAVTRGIIVVEAAANGGNNLDDPVYNTPLAGFPASWTNPFNRANRDSGAVVVGAGNPPAGTHGRNSQPNTGEPYVDRARCGFSNFGAMVDVQGWGWEVTTSGYGDLQGGSSEDTWYTDQFSGTSSASPIVVGALACVQGVLRAAGRIPLSPARARELLRSTGSPQQAATGRPVTQRIGNRPNLRQLIPAALQQSSWTGTQFTGTVPANQTICWFTFNWPAHWHVLWTVVPTSPFSNAPQVTWKVRVTRSSDRFITYWICVTNLTNQPVNIEGRFAVLGW
ncbi:S8 family peptidase [Floridanema aerugineum]|uniref:S8 family peptidase n=1 Tax=Floridaenema aerugineum BLCC-F46 TaxID=3153654 RepID=A0ABV4X5M5_9CYAN